MPLTAIEVRRSYTDAEAAAIIDAVHESLVAAFVIPEHDKHLRFVEPSPARFAVPESLAEPDRYTLVTIDGFAGRSVAAKRNLYTQIVTRLAVFGIPADHVTVIVRDIPAESWGIKGGRAACDVDPGFTVEV